MSLGTFSQAHESLADASDEYLLRTHIEGGTEDALAVLLGRYERELRTYLRRFLYDADAAEDALQETRIKVFLKGRQYEIDAGRKVRPWLYTIATNSAIDLQRKGKRHAAVSLNNRNVECEDGEYVGLLESRDLQPEQALEKAEAGDLVHDALDEIPEDNRVVLLLMVFQGKKQREVAEILGIPLGTVKSRYANAVKKLRETAVMKEQYPEELEQFLRVA